MRRPREWDPRDDGDGICRKGGSQLQIVVTESGQGYATSFDIGLQLE